MPRKPNNLETVRLALELLRRIPRTHAVTAPELRKDLQEAGIDRDLRTVQRQLDELSQHFGIDRDVRSKPYGYRWKEKAPALSLPGLTPHQSLVLRLAEQHLGPLLPTTVLRSMDSFFQQAQDNLRPHTSARKERDWLDKVRVVTTSQPLIPPVIRPGIFEAVSLALYNNEWLDVDYQNATGKASQSRVMSLGLAQQGVRLYLVCRFEGYDNERSLALHRIKKAKATGLPFDRPPEFDLDAFDNEGRFGVSLGPPIKLRMNVTKSSGLHLLETPLAKDQTVKENPNDYEISATVVPTEQLIRWLRGFGDDLLSLKPASLLK